MADLTKQLQLQEQINKILRDRQALLEKQLQLFNQQAAISKQMCDALDCKQLSKVEASARGAKTALNDAASSAEQAGNRINTALNQAGESADKNSEKLEQFKKRALKIAAVTGALRGFVSGVKTSLGMLKGLTRGVFGLTSAFFKLTTTIISLPFRIFSGLLNMAQSGGVSPFRIALEELRKEMGNFREAGVGKNMVSGLLDMRRQFGRTAAGTSRFGRIFGYGREGLAAGLKYTMEMAKAIGPMFGSISKEISANFKPLTKFQKGLGLSMEAFGGIIAKSKAGGKDYKKVFTEMGHYSFALAKKFNMSAKQISRGVGEMANNMEHFGDLTIKEMTETMVYTKRLGIEMKTLQGIIDGFDNFEDAAQNAALLRRQFGMIIDAEKMMNMSGAQRTEYLREQYKKSGLDFEKMSRIEKNVYAKRMKMTSKEAQMIFGKGNAHKKLNDVQGAGDKAAKKRISQTQVLSKLMKQIERVFSSGGKKYKGFFHAFAEGFGLGVRRTREFRRLMINLRMSLRNVRRAGIRVGRAFVKHFPGVKQMIKGMSDFFSPVKFERNSQRLSGAMIRFFKNLSGPMGPRKALETLFEEFKKVFAGFFGDNGTGAKEAGKGFKIFATLIGNIKLMILEKKVELAATLIDGLAGGIEAMVAGKNPLEGAAGKLGDGFNTAFGDSFTRLKDKVKDKLIPAIERLAPAVGNGLLLLAEKLSGWVNANSDKIFGFIVTGMKAMFMLKLKFIKYIFTEHLGFALILAAPIIAKMFMGALAPLIAARMAAAMAAGAASGAAGGGMMAALGGMFKGGMLAKAGGLLASGVGRTLAFGLKRFPLIAAGYAIFKGVSASVKEAGRKDSTLGSTITSVFTGTLEAATFGLFSSDKMLDGMFGGTRYRDGLLERQKAAADASAKALKQNLRPTLEKAKKMSADVLKDTDKFNTAIEKLLQKGKAGGISPEARKALMEIQDIEDDQARIAKGSASRIANLTAEIGRLDKIGSALPGALKKATGTFADSNAEIAWDDDSKYEAYRIMRHLQKRFGKKYAWMEGKVLKIDDDLWQDFSKGALKKAMAEATDPSTLKKAILAEGKAAASRMQDTITSIPMETMMKAYDAARRSGDTATMEALKAKMQKQIGLIEMRKALVDAGQGWRVDQMGIQEAYDAYLKTLSKKAGRKFRAAYELNRDQKLQEHTKPILTEAEIQANKLSKLEAAHQTMQRMDKLKDIPQRLVKLEAAFKKIKPKQIQARIKKVFKLVGKLSDVVNEELVAAGLHKKKDTVSETAMQNFKSIQEVTKTVNDIVGKKSVAKATVDARIRNIRYAIKKIGSIRKQFVDRSDKMYVGHLKDGVPAGIMTGLYQIRDNLNVIAGSNGIFAMVPKNINKRVKRAQYAIREVGAMARALNNSPDIAFAVEIGKKLSDGKDIRFYVKRQEINVSLKINLDARHLAKKLVRVDLINGEGHDRIATLKDMGP